MRGAVAVDAVELAAAREAPATSLRRHLGGEALAAFAAPALEDRPAAAGAHPCPESVGLGPLPLLRLVGPLHSASQYTDGLRKLLFGICDRAGIAAARRVAMVARGCTKTPTDSSSTPSGGTSRDASGPRSRTRPSSSGCEPLQVARRARDDSPPLRPRRHPLLGRAPLRGPDPRSARGRRRGARRRSASRRVEAPERRRRRGERASTPTTPSSAS